MICFIGGGLMKRSQAVQKMLLVTKTEVYLEVHLGSSNP